MAGLANRSHTGIPQNKSYLENERVAATQIFGHVKRVSALEVLESKVVEESVTRSNANISPKGGEKTETKTDELICNKEEELAVTQAPQSKYCFCGGFLLVWGCGEFGQHGHGHTKDVLSCNVLGSPLWLGQDRMVVDVACGSSHTLALTDDNKVYSWGNSNSGQLGIGGIETNPHPRALHIGVSSGSKVTGITCGTRHSFIWTQDGDCFSFGNNFSGQLGYDFRKPDFKENQLRPVFVDSLLRRQVSQVACGSRHSVFLFTNGQVAAVGVNSRGQIGCGDTVDVVCPKTVPDLPPISIIACGNSHNLAADVDGLVYAWGYSKACGSKRDVLSPSCVYSRSNRGTVIEMAGGDSHSLILLSSGAVCSWGSNFEGQLGHGRIVKFLSEPRELSRALLPGTVISISVGENTCAAVTEDGRLYMWGKNSSQVIRDDENARFFQFEPYAVPLGVWKALKVSCGSWHVVCVVSATPKGEVNEVPEGNSNATTVTCTIDSEVETGSFCTQDTVICEREPIPNQVNESVGDKLPAEEDLMAGSAAIQKELMTHDLDISTGSDVKQELIDTREQLEQLEDIPQSKDSDNDNTTRTKNGSEDVNTNPLIYNYLEEKPPSIQKCVMETANRTNVEFNEEKPVIHSNVLNKLETKVTENNAEKLRGVIAAASQTTTRAYQGENEKEKRTVVPTKILEMELTPDKPTDNGNCLSKESGEFDSQALKKEAESLEITCDYERKPARDQEGGYSTPLARSRVFSEQPDTSFSPRGSNDISVALHSRSLDNLGLYRQHESVGRGPRLSHFAYSPPVNSRSSGGQLNREKRPARMLRRTSFEADYHLPNQPVHTVDIGLPQNVLRTHPPMNRTQSSPSLYSSNLIRSPFAARKVSPGSAKVPRAPPAPTAGDGSLPPRPPARGNRRPLEFKPVFSSGTSWRKRK